MTCRIVLTMLLFTSPAIPALADDSAGEAWIRLFDGSDLNRWTMGPERSWVIENGSIALRREFDGREHNADYLWTKDAYGDFVLELEFKLPDGPANSGVFLRTADLADPVYSGIEVQVSNSFGRRETNRGGTAGAVYDCLAPTANPVRPSGQWNQFRIACQGNRITVVLNGETIVAMDLDQWTEAGKNPDGTPNKFPRPLKDFARRGHVGLQDHGRPIWYRNIRIKPLN